MLGKAEAAVDALEPPVVGGKVGTGGVRYSDEGGSREGDLDERRLRGRSAAPSSSSTFPSRARPGRGLRRSPRLLPHLGRPEQLFLLPLSLALDSPVRRPVSRDLPSRREPLATPVA